MKKIISLILVLVTLVASTLCLYSCGDDLENGTYKTAAGAIIRIKNNKLAIVDDDGRGAELAINFTFELADGKMNLEYVDLDYDGSAISQSYLTQIESYYKNTMDKSIDFVKIDDDSFSFGGAVYSKASHSKFSTELGTGACEYKDTRDVSGRNISYVEIQFRNYGRVIVLLDATTAPRTVENFLKLVNEGFYDGLTIHRVMSDFMIQGGDPKGNGSGGSDKTIIGEFPSNGYSNDISHLRGVISMARSNDKNSASSQFFICNADSDFLDENYAAFGYVVEGMSVVDAITAACVPYTNSSSGSIAVETAKPVIDHIKVTSY